MDRRPGSSRGVCSTRQPGIGQSLFMLRSMGAEAAPFKHQHRPAQSTQTAGEPTEARDGSLGGFMPNLKSLGSLSGEWFYLLIVEEPNKTALQLGGTYQHVGHGRSLSLASTSRASIHVLLIQVRVPRASGPWAL